LHRNDPDQEVREYCAGQTERAARLSTELGRNLGRSLAQGSFLFRGRSTAVDSLDPDLASACKKHLADVAEQVFSRYREAPERAGTDLAEKFLRAAATNLRGVSSQLDPLGLVRVAGSTASIDTAHKALVSIRDHIERAGTVEGKRLLDTFSGPPFGWSQDTTRYLVAALLVGGEIKLKVSGREVTTNGQQAIDALKTNNSFKAVGVALRHDKPSMDVLARAAERLTDLSGEQVLPLENDITKAAQKLLPRLQNSLAPLAEKLAALELPGRETVESANQQVTDLLLSDASDAPQRFGAEDSSLYDALKWGQAARLAFDQGVAETIRQLRAFAQAVDELPTTGAPGELREAASDDLESVADLLGKEDFFRHRADLGSRLTSLEARLAESVRKMSAAHAQRLRDAEQEMRLLPEWAEFTAEEQTEAWARLQGSPGPVAENIQGLKQLLAQQFDTESSIGALKNHVVQEGRARGRSSAVPPGLDAPSSKKRRPLTVPARIGTAMELDALIGRLQALRVELPYAEFEVVIDQG